MWITIIVVCQKGQKMNQLKKLMFSLNMKLFGEGDGDPNPPTPPAPNPPSPPGDGQNPPPTPPADDPNKDKTPGDPNNPPAPNPEDEAEKRKREENAKQAKLRHERDIKKAKEAGDKEGYKRARIKSVGGKNPYSDNAPIETDEDFEFYELQDEVKQKGGNPSNPLEIERLRREKIKEAEAAAEANKTQEEKDSAEMDKQIKEYLDSGHTQEELKEVWGDPKFQEFAMDQLLVVPLKTIIANYQKYFPKEDPGKKQHEMNARANPGDPSNQTPPPVQKKVADMSEEEFAKYIEEVKSGARKIE